MQLAQGSKILFVPEINCPGRFKFLRKRCRLILSIFPKSSPGFPKKIGGKLGWWQHNKNFPCGERLRPLVDALQQRPKL